MENVLRRLSIGCAVAGGAIVLAMIAMSLVSLVGRKLFSAPVPGDIELLQMSIAVAVAAFLPLCEMNDSHIRVDLTAGLFTPVANRILLGVSHVALAGIAALLAWRTALMAADSYAYGAISTMLSVPLWIPQFALVPGLLLLSLCALYRGVVSVGTRLDDDSEVRS
ncbi:TRAP transporter small permease [Halomonas organivorans]|uniref:TRAP transporter small permease protein n=1 Tax=Halomonas organivorans TaxID=257772 RepID=A0A7W5BZ21_9GAMM|nr:TRAP transporter small permease subunit [Halomonas organivorans]MBB3141429.1 TRAP-type C4-dicarboxylate transport system permease small subunit [Halomonas organivorans]